MVLVAAGAEWLTAALSMSRSHAGRHGQGEYLCLERNKQRLTSSL
jgi:hypothetical protein